MRHRGTANSSLTLRPSARGSAKRRWWASQGERPQTRQGWDATNSRCRLSRRRRVFGVACPGGWLGLEGCRMVVVPGLAAFDNGRSARSAVGSLATISGVPSFAIFTSKALSSPRVLRSEGVLLWQHASRPDEQRIEGRERRKFPEKATAEKDRLSGREHRLWARSGELPLWARQRWDGWNGRIPVHLPRRGWLVAVLLELAPDDRQVRSIKVILTSDADQREQAIAPGVGQSRAHALWRGRLAHRTYRPVGRHPLA